MAFPYPTLFYLASAPLARLLGSVDAAVLLLAASVSALEVLLVARLAALLLPEGRRVAPYAAWAAAFCPAGYGILTVALYPSLAAHVAETGTVFLLARGGPEDRRVPIPVLVGAVVFASALHVAALINLAAFCLVLAVMTRSGRPLVVGALGLAVSLSVSYRGAFSLVPPVFSSLGDRTWSSYFLQLEPPQSFSFMGGYVWLLLGAAGLALLWASPRFPFLAAWGVTFLLLRGVRIVLGPAGAHLKELQFAAPLLALGAGHVLGRVSKGRRAWVGAAVLILLGLAAFQWVVEHERWLWPLSGIAGR